MNDLLLYCLSLDPNHHDKIKKMGFIPVGLGESSFSNNWLKDNSGKNISKKNKFYGEYTFHYWLWKNYIDQNVDNNKWIGFCQYRKFWTSSQVNKKIENFNELNNVVLKKIPESLKNFETILGEPYFINQFRFFKFIRRNFKKMIYSPSLIFNSSKRNIKFHFDMWHGDGNLEKAINLLEDKDRNDFKDFVEKNISFNPHNMFICRSKEILKKYYESVFPWLFKCEDVFGFETLKGYGLQRIYGFLAERYMSYWFRKYTSSTTLPILFKDITDLNYKP